jgi:hypothetical protein
MRKLLVPAALALLVVIVSCSNPTTTPSYPPVTATDSQQAFTAISSVGSAYANFSYGISYYPNQTSYNNLTAGSYVIITITLSNYTDATTGYTISGTLTYTLTNGSPTGTGVTLMQYAGNFTFSGGPGIVKTATINVTYNWQTFAYTGTVTVNGQTFAP